MNPELAVWRFGLLFAVFLTVLGVVAVVSWRQSGERLLAKGMALQGMLLIFVVAGAYLHQSASVRLGGLIVVTLLLIQAIVSPAPDRDEATDTEERSP